MPVAHAVAVDLRQHQAVITVDAIEFLIHRRAHVGRRMPHIRAELIARHGLLLAVDLQRELELAGDHVVQLHQRVDAVHIFEVDQFLLGFAERVGLEVACGFQIVAAIAGGRHQPLGLGVVQALEPQAEEQRAVLHVGGQLIHARLVDQRFLLLRIFGEPQQRIAHQMPQGHADRFVSIHHAHKIRDRHLGREARSGGFKFVEQFVQL